MSSFESPITCRKALEKKVLARLNPLAKADRIATTEEHIAYRLGLESPEQQAQYKKDHEDFMQQHKNFTYNCFTAHMVG